MLRLPFVESKLVLYEFFLSWSSAARSAASRLASGSPDSPLAEHKMCGLTTFNIHASRIHSEVHVHMKMLMMPIAKASVLGSCLAFTAFACNRSADSNQDTAQIAQTGQTPNPDAPIMLRGTVTSVSANQLVLKSDTGAVTVTLARPFHLYVRAPSDLSHVKQNSFIGVTTVKQPDGSERATEIHVFPEELRGVGEGSRMMAPAQSGGASRMTNGNVSTSRMTNGTASQSRMSNGRVSSTNGSSLVVQYAGGSQNVTVPPNTPVTELKLASKNVAVGDQLAVLAKKAPDGSLTADKAISTAK
jgi:uncharacterized protein DUF5666